MQSRFERFLNTCAEANEDSPYYQWLLNDDPEPMIKLLRKALKKQNEKLAKKKGKK